MMILFAFLLVFSFCFNFLFRLSFFSQISWVYSVRSEKAMAPHSSTLAWKIPWTEELGRLQSMGSLRVGHDFTFTFTFHFHALKKEMATHSSTLIWKIPWMEEPGRLQSMGSRKLFKRWEYQTTWPASWEICMQVKKQQFVYTTERLHFHFSLSYIGEVNGSPLQCSWLENPRDGEPGGLPSMGSHRVGHDWRYLATAAAKCEKLF